VAARAGTWSAVLFWSPERLTAARYCIMIFTDSVLPAPDSPDTRIDWFATRPRSAPSISCRYASSAIA